MTFPEFEHLVMSSPDGVVLLEGRRSIPSADAEKASRCAAGLAKRFPSLRFRSGNAEGSDEAFSRGVASVDPGRLQIVLPYPTHRSGSRYPDATYTSPSNLTTTEEQEIAWKTAAASPKNKGLISKRAAKAPFAAKAAYLIRDTMKVAGHSGTFQKPVCALFYVSSDDPMAGGTGHTIRVCQSESVPCVFQDAWAAWPV